MIDLVTSEILRKFNSGKNAEELKSDTPLGAGTWQHSVTVTIEGTLVKKEAGTADVRNNQGCADIVRYLLDRLNPDEFNALARDLVNIRHGEFDHKDDTLFAQRLDVIMPKRTVQRAGRTEFHGRCIIEDMHDAPSEESQGVKGLTLVMGE